MAPCGRLGLLVRVGAAVVWLSLLASSDAALPFGIQTASNDDGFDDSNSSSVAASAAAAASSYATSMFFDADIERLHVVGATYGSLKSLFRDASTASNGSITEEELARQEQQQQSNEPRCFLSSLQLPQPFRAEQDNGRPVWVRHALYGPSRKKETNSSTSTASVVCSSVYMGVSRGIRTYFLAGYSAPYPDFVLPKANSSDETASSSDAASSQGSSRSNNSSSIQGSSFPRRDGNGYYGFTMELNFAAQLSGGQVLEDQASGGGTGRAHYPIAIVGNDTQGQGLVVATVQSIAPYSTSVYRRYLDNQNTPEPNPDVRGAFVPPRFERGCSVTLSGWEQTRLNDNVVPLDEVTNFTSTRSGSNSSSGSRAAASTKNLRLAWTKELKSSEGDSVFLSSLLMVERTVGSGSDAVGGKLMAAGYTAGTGPDLGSGKSDATIDSFVTSLDPQTGITIRSMRLQSRSNSTDLILGLCAPASPSSQASSAKASSFNSSSKNVASYFYVVGMSNERSDQDSGSGIGSYKTFVLKLDADTFDLVWTAEIRPVVGNGVDNREGDARGISCAVTRDGAVLYVAGTVTRGASLVLGNGTRATTTTTSTNSGTNTSTNTITNNATLTTVSSGGDDIFIAQLRAGDGAVRFLKQIGTSEDDWVASGDCLKTDNQGNALVLGNTRGSMFRQRSTSATTRSSSDVVVFSVSRVDGSHVEVAELANNASESTPNSTSPSANGTASSPSSTTNSSAVPTPAPSVNTSSRHDGTTQSDSPSWNLRRNRTDSAPFNSTNLTNTTLTNSSSPEGDGPFKVEPYTPPSGQSITDSILIAAIAVLVVIIGASCLALLVIRSNRRRRGKAIARSLSNAEEPMGVVMPGHRRSGSSLRWTGRGPRNSWGSGARRSRRSNLYNDNRGAPQDQDPTETSSCGASYISGETLRPAPRPLDTLDADTLLRLDPSLRSLGSDGDDDDSCADRFGHRIADEDLYHPSVTLNSVRRSSGPGRSRASVDQWDVEETRRSDRAFVMPVASRNNDEDDSLLDSDTIPTWLEGEEADHENEDDDEASDDSSGGRSFVETIDGVPLADEEEIKEEAEQEEAVSAFDPSTLATFSGQSVASSEYRVPVGNIAGRVRRGGSSESCSSDDNSTGYSMDMLRTWLRHRQQRGVDPEPSKSKDDGGMTSRCEKGEVDDGDDDSSLETGGVLS